MRADAATDRRSRRRGAAQLVRRRGDDPARLSRSSGRASSRPTALGIFSHPRRADRRGRLPSARCAISSRAATVPLIAKAERKSTVHRRVPLDLVVRADPRGRQDHRHRRPCRPVDQPGADAAGRGSAGAAPPPQGARRGHSASIPRAIAARRCATRSRRCRATCWSTSATKAARELVTMAMSLADRPRPALLLRPQHPQGPSVRLRLAAARRADHPAPASTIGEMLEESVGARGDQLVGRAWRRRPRADPLHARHRRRRRRLPDAEALDAQLDRDGPRLGAERRGSADRRWSAPGRATRLALTYAGEFPDDYRARTSPDEAAPRHPPPAAARRRRRPRRPLLPSRRSTASTGCASRSTAAAA